MFHSDTKIVSLFILIFRYHPLFKQNINQVISDGLSVPSSALVVKLNGIHVKIQIVRLFYAIFMEEISIVNHQEQNRPAVFEALENVDLNSTHWSFYFNLFY